MRTICILALAIVSALTSVSAQHARTKGALATWSLEDPGQASGFSGFEFAPLGTGLEIVAGGGHDPWNSSNSYWFVLEFDRTRREYLTRFVSPSYATDESIIRLLVRNLPSHSGPEVILLLKDGSVEIWDQASRTILRTIKTSATAPLAMAIDDVDQDGMPDLVIAERSHLWVYDALGKPLWNKAGIGGAAIAIGQMDADPSPEIVCEDGEVIDVATVTVQASLGKLYCRDMQAIDIDGDQREELLVCSSGIRAFDVDFKREKFRITVSDTRFMAIGDIDGNGNLDAVLGTAQTDEIVFVDLSTRLITNTIRKGYRTTSRLLIGNLDSDRHTEVAWANGPTSHGPQPIQIMQPATGAYEYKSHEFYNGLVGPFEGDIDGDGQNEIVVGSSGLRDGVRLFVLDGVTLDLLSSHVGSQGRFTSEFLVDIDLVDVDGDGDDDIVTTADDMHVFEYDKSSRTVQSVWSLKQPQYPVERLQASCVGDFDGDTSMEIATATEKALYVYDIKTKQLLWSSFFIGKRTLDILAADTDGDSVMEIHCLSSDGHIYVFDGKTHLADAVLQAGTSKMVSMNIHSQTGRSFLLSADEAGGIWAHLWIGSGFTSLGPLSMSNQPIDNFGLLPITPFSFLATDQRFSILTGATPAWTTAQYGERLGQQFIFRLQAPHVIANGAHGLFGFDIK